MNKSDRRKEQFERFMNEIDDAYLEEAQAYTAKKPERSVWLRRAVSAAACVCLVAAGISLFQPGQQNGMDVTLEDLQTQGFSLMLPEEAQAESFALGEDGMTAQADFELNGSTYVWTAEKTDAPVIPEGDGQEGWISWYGADGVQYVLTGNAEEGLKSTAYLLMINMGLDMNVAPEGAENILYYTVNVEGSAGETLNAAAASFELEGVRYDYRTAATGMFEVQDLSGHNAEVFENQSQAELGWCMADLFWTDGASGKILWLDFAPGLLYSLSMESGASEEALLSMAETLFTPVQGDVN